MKKLQFATRLIVSSLALSLSLSFYGCGTSTVDETQSNEVVSEATETSGSDDSEKDNEINNDTKITKSIGKEIKDIDINISKKVNNDSTGNSRLATTSDDFDITEYVVSYYNTYFEDDSEVHYLINFTQKTTTVINSWGSVSVHEYVENEEHDADTLASGTLLAEYIVDMETGKIDKIQ